MIERMQKYLFLIYHRDYNEFLDRLRNLGVVHIKETKSPKQFDELQALVQKRSELAILQRRVKSFRTKDAPEIVTVVPQTEEQGLQSRSTIENLFSHEARISAQEAAQKRDIDYWSIWGAYDLERLKTLEKSGYKVRFYTVPSQQFNEDWLQQYHAIKINDYRAQAYFVTVGQPEETRLEADEVKASTVSIEEMKQRLVILQEELADTRAQIVEFANTRIGELAGYDLFIARSFDYANALIQAEREAEDTLMVLEGWVPEREAAAMTQDLKAFPCYFEQMEIKPSDSVPIKLKNNRYARLFEMITKMYSLPNYGEIDITALFAPFFMLFFALCFGDGGYGLLLLVGATIARMKTKDESTKNVFAMMQWLGGTTSIVGSLMGTVFGMVMPWAGDDILGNVSNDYFLNQDNMMALSLLLGLGQIIFGRFIAGYKTHVQRGFKYALATYGWATVILFGALAFAANQIGSVMAMYVCVGIATVAFLMVLFYNTPGKNVFVNFGSGLWATYNTASGLLGDMLSYIRLFAIGLSGGILGGVFNNLAVQIGGDLPVGVNFIVMALILLFGHSINFGLCMISSLVHPLRLTFVEFYKNAEFEGGGRAYTPFK